MNSKYFIETYGCQMNVYDSELVAGLLENAGYTSALSVEDADALFLNTCSIREKAEETVHNRLQNFQSLKRNKPQMLIGVLGCMAQNLRDDLLTSKPFVDIILGPDAYRRLPDILKNRQSLNDHVVDTHLSRYEVYEDLFPTRGSGINAWISISRGCDNFCTFCIVPFTRGRERSRSIDSIVDETKTAVSQGFLEITLLGQNVNSFKTDQGAFPELLSAVAAVPGIQRVRYTSPHPRDVDDHLLEVMRDHPVICPHIHLPLQAGADRILERMNRTYSKSQFLDLVNRIHDYLPGCALTTDIIVGFPGETDEDFSHTLDVMQKVKFHSSFMFKYSPRPGTKAAEYSDQIEEAVKQERLEAVIAMQKEHSLFRNRQYIGRQVQVIVEKNSKKSALQWAGRTETNIWVVWDKNGESIKDSVSVEIIDAQGITLFGHRST